LVRAVSFSDDRRSVCLCLLFIFAANNVSENLPAVKNTRLRLHRAFQIIFEFCEIPVRRVIIRRFAKQCYGLFVRSKMKLHKFSFKNEAVWMLILGAFPLLVAILITLWLFVFRGFDL